MSNKKALLTVRLFYCSADAAVQCAENQHQNADGAEDIFTERIEPREQGLIPSLIDFGFHKFTLAEPEEHDCCQTCAEGADINGQHIHPTGNNALDTDGNNDADDADGKAGRHTGKVEFFL